MSTRPYITVLQAAADARAWAFAEGMRTRNLTEPAPHPDRVHRLQEHCGTFPRRS